MKSINEIKKTARSLITLSKTKGEIDSAKLSYIISLVSEGKMRELGIRIGRQQAIVLLKQLLHLYVVARADKQIQITTAYELPKAEETLLRRQFIEVFNLSEVAFATDKHVIGGIKIQNGWDIIDNSIQAHLQLLHT